VNRDPLLLGVDARSFAWFGERCCLEGEGGEGPALVKSRAVSMNS
jgi:hypothetical protein